MKRESSRKLLSLFLALLLLGAGLPTLPLTVSAVSGGPSVLSGPDPVIYLSELDGVEDDFNRATVDWQVENAEASALTAFDTAPYTVYEGSRSLSLHAEDYRAGSAVRLTRTPTVYRFADEGNRVASVVYAPREAENVTLTLTLKSGSRTFTQSAALEGGRWQAVVFDLSDQLLQGKIDSISLAFTAGNDGDFTFLLDAVGFAEGQDLVTALTYMTTAFEAEGCVISQTDTPMTVTVDGEGQYVEGTAVRTDFSGGLGVCVKLHNNSTCRSLTLCYTTLTETDFATAPTVTVPLTSGENLCLFPLPDVYVGRFRLMFDGAPLGQIALTSVTPALCYTPSDSVGTVSACTVGRDKRTVTVKGYLSDSDSVALREARLYLYRLEMWEEPSDITFTRPILAETALNGSDFSFAVSLSDDGDELYRKYAVMAYAQGTLLPIGQAVSVTNPEILSSAGRVEEAASIKGYYPLSERYVTEGNNATVVEVRLDQLVSLSESNSIPYRAGSTTCRMNEDYIDALDRKMTEYQQNGIKVTFLLRVAKSEDLTLNALLCHPNTADGRYAAFATTTADGIGTLRVVSEFLASRYASNVGISRNLSTIVVGSHVNEAKEHYSLQGASLSELVKSYTAAFRTVYTAVKSTAPSVEVALSLGGDWNSDMTAGQRQSFDARSFLTSFADAIALGGDLDWHLTYDIALPRGSYGYEELSPDLTYDAATVSNANLEVLLSYLGGERFLYGGAPRAITLLETEPFTPTDENESIHLSADYVYTYLRLSGRELRSVKGYLPAHPVDYMQVNTYIDTNRFRTATAFAAEMIGSTRFEALVKAAEGLGTRYLNENQAVGTIPSGIKGISSLFDFSTDTDGFYPSLACASLEGGASYDGESGLLRMRFSAVDAMALRGIAASFDTPLDLTAAPYIAFSLRSAVLPEGVSELAVTVIVTAGKDRQISTITVPAGSKTDVVVDVSSFPARSGCDGIALYICGVDGQDIGEPTLLVSEIRALSKEHEGADLDQVIRPGESLQDGRQTVSLTTVLAIGLVGLLALAAEILRLVNRARRAKRDSEEPSL